MKIDTHQHFWKYNPKEFDWINDKMNLLKRDYLPAEYLSIIKEAGYNGSIAVQARQNLKETSWLLQLAEENEFIKGVVGWVNLCSENVEEQLEGFAANKKLVGIRHVLQDEPDDDFMLGKGFRSGIKSLEKYDLAYDLLVLPRHLQNTIKLVKEFSRQRFILDHLAKPPIKEGFSESWKTEMKLLAEFPNVFCKISGMVTEADWGHWQKKDFTPYLETVMEAFGSNRLMVGSDWPVCTLAGKFSDVMNIAEEFFSTLSENEKNKILFENAKKLYNLA
jgi:L-fuconolactonase